jgi:uncharacterized protein YjeT (DUF2065 family)
MSELAVAFGLVLVIEGLLWATYPKLAMRLLAAAAETPEQVLRVAWAAAVAVGVFVVWLVRG